MKKFIALVLLLVLPLAATAQNFASPDFLGGNQAVLITNNATANFGDSLVPYTNATGTTVYALTNLYTTNYTSGVTGTNTYTYFGQAWNDVPNFSDRNGGVAPLTFSIALIGNTARSTNVLTVDIQRLARFTPGSTNNLPDINSTNKFTCSFWLLGTNNTTVLLTNLPSAFCQGAAGFRVSKLVLTDSSAAASAWVQYMRLGGFAP